MLRAAEEVATKRCVCTYDQYYTRSSLVRFHYDDVIMTMLASQITSLPVVCSIVYSDVNQRKHQSSASLAFVREIHRGPVNFPHKWPVTRKMFPFDDVIMVVCTFGIVYRKPGSMKRVGLLTCLIVRGGALKSDVLDHEPTFSQ